MSNGFKTVGYQICRAINALTLGAFLVIDVNILNIKMALNKDISKLLSRNLRKFTLQ